MKKSAQVVLVILILSLSLFNTASAAPGETAGGCPPGFELHQFMGHPGEHMHQHIGLNQDLNEDGYICVNHLSDVKHLHTDNSIPMK
jgi:hypothetical protein